MRITPLTKVQVAQAAALFAANFQQFRRSIPLLPQRMESPTPCADKLENLLNHSHALAAFEDDRLVGYLGWWLVDGFRDTTRKAAYCPVWAHAVFPAASTTSQTNHSNLVDSRRDMSRHDASRIYRALYRAAADLWFAAGCQTHAITLLAGDAAARDVWFWNGFGLTVVDALRALDPIGAPLPDGYTLRSATIEDCQSLAEIEAEHWQHYAQPPTLMTASGADTAENFATLLADPANRVWLAWKDAELAGYARFEGAGEGASEIVRAEDTFACTGAYTRPAHRGRRLMPALLDAAFTDYRARGYTRCSVDFESINPEAAAFWPTYFEPVCYSVIRVPEREA